VGQHASLRTQRSPEETSATLIQNSEVWYRCALRLLRLWERSYCLLIVRFIQLSSFHTLYWCDAKRYQRLGIDFNGRVLHVKQMCDIVSRFKIGFWVYHPSLDKLQSLLHLLLTLFACHQMQTGCRTSPRYRR